MQIEVRELSLEDISGLKRSLSYLEYRKRIGRTTCPHCGQKNVLVMNDSGPGGPHKFSYIDHHTIPDSDKKCPKSWLPLPDL